MLEILCGGIVGAFVGGLGFLVSKALVDPQKHPERHRIVLIVFVVVGIQIGNTFVTPEVRAWQNKRELDEFLSSNSLYSAVLADHPELRGPLETAVLRAVTSQNRAEATAAASAVLAPVFPEYLSRASDEAVLGSTRALVSALTALQNDDPKRCYQYLNPGVDGFTSLTEVEGRSEVIKWMEEAVKSAQADPQTSEADDEVMASLEGVQNRLIERYGDLSPLADSSAPGVDKAEVCEMTIALYEDVLGLPSEEGASLVRYLYAPSP